MAEIPDRLKQRGIYFVLIKARDKKPFQMGWQKKTIEYDNPELLEHLKNGGNFGVLGGGPKNLILVDFDDVSVQEKALQVLPDTFTVRTGSGLLHMYYYTDNHPESFKGFSQEMNTLFDAQAENKQVVGPSSIHPNGNKYEILHNHDIAFIEYEKLKSILSSHDQRPKKEVKENKEFIKVGPQLGDDMFLEELKRKATPEKVLNYLGIDTSTNPCACPLHDSKGGHCLGFDDVTLHCFHCENSFNAFTLIKAVEKCSFKNALEIMVKIAGMETEYLENKKKYIDQMRIKQDEFIQDEKKKVEVAALNKDKGYVAGKISLDDEVKFNDINGNKIDPVADDAIIKLIRRQKIKQRILKASEPAGERAKDPERIDITKEEKIKGTMKLKDEENPYK